MTNSSKLWSTLAIFTLPQKNQCQIKLPTEFCLLIVRCCLNIAPAMPLFRYQRRRSTAGRIPDRRLNGTAARASRQISRVRVTAVAVLQEPLLLTIQGKSENRAPRCSVRGFSVIRAQLRGAARLRKAPNHCRGKG